MTILLSSKDIGHAAKRHAHSSKLIISHVTLNLPALNGVEGTKSRH